MIVTKFSKIGQYHKMINAKSQDVVYSFENSDICYISIADGASSCKNSKKGAQIACKCAKNLLAECNVFSFDTKKISYVVWEEIIFHIKQEAAKQKIPVGTFASTFAFACFDKRTQRLVTYNLGDGAIFVKYETDKEYRLLAEPKRRNGMCTLIPNTDAYKDVDISVIDFFKGEVLLCTDGFFDIMQRDNVKLDNVLSGFECIGTEDDASFIMMTLDCEVSV